MSPRSIAVIVVATSALTIGLYGQSFTSATATPASGQLRDLHSARAGSPQREAVADNQTLTFYWGLKRNDTGAGALVREISTPGSANYRHFLRPAQVANRFGATRTTVAAVKKYVARKGLVGTLDKSRVFMRVKGTAAQFTAAFGQPIEAIEVGGFTAYTTVNNPTLPPPINRLVPAPGWVSQSQNPNAKGAHRPSILGSGQRSPLPLDEGTLHACAALKAVPFLDQTMTVAQAAHAYGMTNLQTRSSRARGDVSTRAPIGVLAFGSGFSSELLSEATRCYGVGGSAYRIETDGMTAPLPSGPGEGDLDVQIVLAGLAARHRIPVFETSEIDATWFLSPAAALNSPNVPTVLTVSYGLCEAQINSYQNKTNNLMDAIFMRLDLVGTSVLVASGDSGSSGCVNHDDGQGPEQLAVSYPSTSPWVTAVGGTRIVLTKSNKRSAEYAWNDKPWGRIIAGGGGSSIFYRRPWWQSRKIAGNQRRAVPDISAHGSTAPGYPLVGAGQPQYFAEPYGGTSTSTPLTATGIALINLKLAANGRPPLGFLNPWLYQLPRSATFDVIHGNNDLYNQGCCAAHSGYDKATGIGSPNFAKMFTDID